MNNSVFELNNSISIAWW